ncbi:MAG: cupin domain-containing protein [Caldilineaceae bacterium]
MIHLTPTATDPKGWLAGPWNSAVPVAVGYANEGIDIRHYHTEMYEIYLVAQGESVALVGEERISLRAKDLLIVEPGEVHTFVESTSDYFHFVIQTPFMPGDKCLVTDK